ncbi:MAG TPA: hypothetical protein PL031_10760, partial [Neisseria sp.]|nr:hypothetical protein [Neisseria sp.]
MGCKPNKSTGRLKRWAYQSNLRCGSIPFGVAFLVFCYKINCLEKIGLRPWRPGSTCPSEKNAGDAEICNCAHKQMAYTNSKKITLQNKSS